MSLVIHPETYEYSHEGPYGTPAGTVEVTINGEKRRWGCLNHLGTLALDRLFGRVESGRKWWEIKVRHENGSRHIEVNQWGMRHYSNKTWAEFAFQHP